MRLVDRYVASYAVTILVSGLLLMIAGVRTIEVYYAVYLIEFLVAMELVASFRESLGRTLRPVVLAFLLGFAYIVLHRIFRILG